MKRSICLIFAVTLFVLATAEEVKDLTADDLVEKPILIAYASRLIELHHLQGVTKEELPNIGGLELIDLILQGLNNQLGKKPDDDEVIKQHIQSFEQMKVQVQTILKGHPPQDSSESSDSSESN